MPRRPRAGYKLGVRDGILSPKHVALMGKAVWLWLWFVKHQTDVDGRVLGGRALTWEEIDEDLGVGRRSLQRWRSQLEQERYITTDAAPRGFTVVVRHQKKFEG